MKSDRKVIIIVGTNASGKSGLAIKLAKKYNGEIISADSRQVYKGLNIATGKVTKKEMNSVMHHLIDVVNFKNTYTAANFAIDGQKALEKIVSKGKIPIIAGGTGFYIDALLNPKMLAQTPPDENLRTELEKETTEQLFSKLKKLDTERASFLKKKNEHLNKRRLIRSIEIAIATKTNGQVDPFPICLKLWIGLRWDKEKLEKRIKERTELRIKQGMIAEAHTLHKKGLTYKRMRELGLEYKHLANYLQNKITKDELVENIIIGDRQYAKRQRTWFKRNNEINWFKKENFGKIDTLVEKFLN